MSEQLKLVIFEVDNHRYALHLEFVERVIRIVEVTPLPRVPKHVMGIINLQGKVIPVINMRNILELPERKIQLNDQLIIVHSMQRTFALYVDSVIGNTVKQGEEITKAENVYTGIQHIEGIIKFEDGLTLIHNPEKFLSHDEFARLQEIIKPQTMKTENNQKPKINPGIKSRQVPKQSGK